ncbi:RNA-directed DNA polymerase, eukaryota, partial [Tanacetum coccineum]
MTKKDEEKTAFHMEEGVFCYTKMPFGLKNAGATYQRLVDSPFKEQIGVNLEAYVDGMVIKSKIEQDIIKDIEQTLSTLRRINMKLNPKKCSFVMEEGKFLGYVVTSEGIRANPKKAKAVMDMPSPKTLKQMQSLKAAEAAFLEMKMLVSELPTLSTPKNGETLMMYLAAANEAVSAVLLTERNGRQMPIHYVSRSLQGAETNYDPMEKLALALVHAARQLRRYFQAHPIKVITDSPIRQVLNNSGASERLAKWAVELGAYGITYVPSVAIKGKVLADTLTEISATAERLYTDGASNNEGSGAVLILIAPDDVEYSYALRLNFSNSNNEAEYEALLAGLRIAKEMQVRDIHAFVDSKLVANQVEGSYEAKRARMIKYREKVLELAGAFNRLGREQQGKQKNSRNEEVSKISVNIYVTNFPYTVDSMWLPKLCEKHGIVVDVYLSKNLFKLSKRYVFVRFIKVDGVHSLIDNLRNIWIGSYKMFASSVIRDRFGNMIKDSHDTPSYASVVEPKLKSTISKPDNEPIELVSGDYVVSNDECDKVCLGLVKEIASLPVLVNMCKAQGFLDLDICYMGATFGLVSRFCTQKRLVWLDCDGLPVRAWSAANFYKLAFKGGNVVHMDDDLGPTLATTKICVETGRMDIIAEEKCVDTRDMEPSLEGDAIDFAEEVNSLHSVHDEDALDNLHDSDPFSLSDLIRKEADKAKLQRMEKLNADPGLIALRFGERGKGDSLIEMGITMGYSMKGCAQDKLDVINCIAAKQETKVSSIDIDMVRSLWGNTHFDYLHSDARGLSGGILVIWEPNLFIKYHVFVHANYVAILGVWASKNVKTLMVSVYFPQDWASKKQVWKSLLQLFSRTEGEIMVMGDFNEVRDASERFGTVFHEHTAHDFNQFIHDSNLVDVPLGGFSFTWSNRLGTKMSKLDRFLLSEGMFDVFQHLATTKKASQIGSCSRRGCLMPYVLLREHKADYGPPPFRLFHSWMELDGFDDLVKDSWEVPVVGESNAMIIFNKKLQSLKNNIKNWNKIRRQTSEARISQLWCEVKDIQNRVEDGSTSIDDIQKRVHLIKQIRDIEHVENLDLAQKAKVKRVIEGDENSSYFHSSINRKRRQAAMRGVIKDGVWMVEPNDIKAEFKDHFQSRFSKDGGVRPTILSDCFLKLSTNQITSLDAPFSCEEIKKAAWDCGSDKAPGPDGFTFGFFNRFWEVIKEDVFALVRSLQNRRVILRGCNPSFIALIPKVDFEKAYDSLSWDFLFEVMNKMGFTINWFAWVKATLTSSRASVLLNGAPTEEFDIQRGLRKGDPLSPFLFVLVMEGFHVGISEACRANAFQGVSTGSSDIRISHLLYADDAILLCDWGLTNFRDDCGSPAFPVGCNMNHIDSWKPMIDKFNKKLSSWKAKLLFVGGRLTLLKSVIGSLAIYYMYIFKVPVTVLQMLESLRARFFWGADLGDRKLHWIVDNPNALWARIVSSIHDTHREGGARPSSWFGGLSPWVNVGRAMEHLEVK